MIHNKPALQNQYTKRTYSQEHVNAQSILPRGLCYMAQSCTHRMGGEELLVVLLLVKRDLARVGRKRMHLLQRRFVGQCKLGCLSYYNDACMSKTCGCGYGRRRSQPRPDYLHPKELACEHYGQRVLVNCRTFHTMPVTLETLKLTHGPDTAHVSRPKDRSSQYRPPTIPTNPAAHSNK